MIIQYINFKSELSEEEILRIAKERKSQFRAISGLVQKYYVKGDQPGHYGGVYIWDSVESLQDYRMSDLAASIPNVYKIIGKPKVEILDVLFQLREAALPSGSCRCFRSNTKTQFSPCRTPNPVFSIPVYIKDNRRAIRPQKARFGLWFQRVAATCADDCCAGQSRTW